jgi:predicted esterase
MSVVRTFVPAVFYTAFSTALTAALLMAPTLMAEDLPAGKVVEKVACSAQPTITYALYLPSGYTPGKKWPIVYALDASKRALDPMEVFHDAAERHGVIVVSSYDSASDTDPAPTVAAVKAMWDDTHARFSIDDHRIYFAGYSGTVRISCYLAIGRPGTITGIIGASAGFPMDRRPKRDTDFLFFGTSGIKDFNYSELHALDLEMNGLQLPHRIEYFSGGHEWMPAPLVDEALDWMELRSILVGTTPKDEGRIAALWSADLGRAKALESAGEIVDAARMYRAIVTDYAGLRDTTAATAAAARVEALPDYASKLKARQKALKTEETAIAQSQRVIALEKDDAAAIDQLHITMLRRQASGTGEDALAAQRILNTLWGQTAHYIPTDLRAQKQYTKAIHYLHIAAAIRPESPRVHYNLAAMHSLSGDKRGALAELQRAFALGFDQIAYLQQDEDFTSLREDEGFKKLLASAPVKGGKS